MSRIQPIDPQTATGKTKELLGMVEKKLGVVPNMMKTLANAPAALEAYLTLSGTLGHTSSLGSAVREQIALTVGQLNKCQYCVSAHTVLAGKAGVGEEAIKNARQAKSTDPKINAILGFAKNLALNNGNISDQELSVTRTAGVTDKEILEIIAEVSLNIMTNYFNHVADTEIDFPKVAL